MAIFNVYAQQFFFFFSETSMTVGVCYILHISIIIKLLVWACSKLWLMIILFSSLRSLRSFSTRHGGPDIISQYQSTVSRSCGPSLLVLRTLEHYLEHWGSKVLPTPLGGEKIFFYITDFQSTFTKCHLCINIYLFIYLFVCLFVCLSFWGCIYFYYYY